MLQTTSVPNSEPRCVLSREVLTLNSIPLHAVLGRDLSKAVLGNGHQGAVAEVVVVDLSAKVRLALGYELGIETTGGAGTSGRSGSAASSAGGSRCWSGRGRSGRGWRRSSSTTRGRAGDALRVVCAESDVRKGAI